MKTFSLMLITGAVCMLAGAPAQASDAYDAVYGGIFGQEGGGETQDGDNAQGGYNESYQDLIDQYYGGGDSQDTYSGDAEEQITEDTADPDRCVTNVTGQFGFLGCMTAEGRWKGRSGRYYSSHPEMVEGERY